MEAKDFVRLAGANGVDKLFLERSNWLNFAFDEQVVQVFPDMISRSVPGYWEVNQKTAVWAKTFYQDNTVMYDLGASLGAASWGIAQLCQEQKPKIIAVEQSSAMVAQFAKNLAVCDFFHNIEIVEGDICTQELQPTSVVVCNYCLQFISPTQRKYVLQKIYDALVPNGVLLLAEKIAMESVEEDEAIRELHHQWKLQQGYTLNEIERKSRSIANVMPVDTLSTHVQRLKGIGFQSVVQWSQHFNFVAMVVQK